MEQGTGVSLASGNGLALYHNMAEKQKGSGQVQKKHNEGAAPLYHNVSSITNPTPQELAYYGSINPS